LNKPESTPPSHSNHRRDGTAEQIIKAVMAPNEEVNAVGPVSVDQVKAFGLKSGDYIHSRPQP
jgi:hypothetical protein